MSIEASWDLYATFSPRSLCVYPVSHGSSSSSSGAATSTAAGSSVVASSSRSLSNVVAAVYGTDRGSVHYRCYNLAPSQPQQQQQTQQLQRTSFSSQQQQQQQQQPTLTTTTISFGGSGAPTRVFAPLGIASGGQGKSPTHAGVSLPRIFYPVDMTNNSLPGPVVSCISIHAATTNVPLFLILCDDSRGSSSAQPGAYSAYWLTLHHGTFTIFNNTAATLSTAGNKVFTLPRLSAAVAAHGRIYATAGRTLFTLRIPNVAAVTTQTSNSTSDTTTSSQRSNNHTSKYLPSLTRLHFGNRVWPGPVRSGPDAIAVVAQGRVVVGCVGHAFYAVAGQEIHRNDTADHDDDDDDDYYQDGYYDDVDVNKTLGTDSSANHDNVVKLVHWTQSSQVHPVVALDLGDLSMETDWSCLFLANGRECAVVDLYYGPASQPRFASMPHKPRNGIVTTASPILAAASSWPLLAILMSDGLCSVRSPSCLAVSLRTVEIGTRPNDFFTLRSVLLLPNNFKVSVWGDDTLGTQPSASLPSSTSSFHWTLPWIIAISYAGEGKVMQCRPDTAQDLADRLMRLAIDAFGGNGFPRTDLAKAVQASFTATSYVGPEPSLQARFLLKEYLEAVLGLCDWESGASSGWPTQDSPNVAASLSNPLSRTPHTTLAAADGDGGGFHGKWTAAGDSTRAEGRSNPRPLFATVLSAAEPAALLAHTSLLCLVATQLSPPAAQLASRAAKACASAMGVVLSNNMDEAAVSVGQQVADQLLRESSHTFSLVNSSAMTSKAPTIPRIHRPAQVSTDYIEAAIWLLRSCGQHERAMEVAAERLQQNPSPESGGTVTGRSGQWSRIKYESYTATHLSELWCCGQENARELVLRSMAAQSLLESNPRLGLSVFTSLHPQNETQWRELSPSDDPFRSTDCVFRVLSLLKSIRPKIPSDDKHHGAISEDTTSNVRNNSLPLESGRALAVTFLESAIGISTGRPLDLEYGDQMSSSFPLNNQLAADDHEEVVANFHDELALSLLEGVISERSDESDQDTELGSIYRSKLRHLLRWPLAQIRPERFLESLPPSFLPEKAFILGRLGRHDDALRILYRDLKSLDMALDYCDDRYQSQQAMFERQQRLRQMNLAGGGGDNSGMMYQDGEFDAVQMMHGRNNDDDNAYLPLVRVALESDDTEKGCAAAIQVLALRRTAIDRAAALRLLPPDIPVSAVARPFLIPALVDSESQVRRLTVVSALLRARYIRLKEQLTAAQLKAQANLQVVPQLRSLNLGDPLHSTKPFRARTSGGGNTGNNMPEVWIVKHFFPRHLVIQARVTNQAGLNDKAGRTLTDICFVVAESSEEAIQPLLQVPIAVLPSSMTGSTWCVLSAAPTRMEGSTAILTCELRYTVGQGDVAMFFGSNAGQSAAMAGKTFVEELQDLEVHASHF